MQIEQSTSGIDFLLPDLPVGGGMGGRRSRIEAAIREAISDGRLRPGDRLPSTRALARDLAVARSTIVDAYAQLTAEGWITGAHGSGTRVAATADEHITSPPPAGGSDVEHRFDFTPGRPDVSAFPRAAWIAAMRRALRTAPDSALSYGDPRGHVGLREELAGYLGRVRGVRAHPDDIVVCSGFSGSLALIGGVLAGEGVSHIGIEQPCLAHHRAIVESAGLTAAPMPVDDDGAQVEYLESTSAMPAEPAAVLLTPAHQQPVGSSLSAARRGWVLQWARRTRSVIVEDDYDSEFRFDRAPLGALQGRAPDAVVHAGTVSKTLAPGLRLGWLVVPSRLRRPLLSRRAELGGQHPVLDQLALAELIRSGAYDRHVRRMRLRYRARRDALVAALVERAPALHVSGIAAGLQATVELPPDGPSAAEVCAVALEHDVALHALSDHHWYGGSATPEAVVVGYGTPPEHAYRAALAALLAVFADLGLAV